MPFVNENWPPAPNWFVTRLCQLGAGVVRFVAVNTAYFWPATPLVPEKIRFVPLWLMLVIVGCDRETEMTSMEPSTDRLFSQARPGPSGGSVSDEKVPPKFSAKNN